MFNCVSFRVLFIARCAEICWRKMEPKSNRVWNDVGHNLQLLGERSHIKYRLPECILNSHLHCNASVLIKDDKTRKHHYTILQKASRCSSVCSSRDTSNQSLELSSLEEQNFHRAKYFQSSPYSGRTEVNLTAAIKCQRSMRVYRWVVNDDKLLLFC
ncbi:unnamed protein product [Clavelina lepadiformis]|uniref:Uncharacterized protein n=1 Tax=Clavelina lepadiformis TaxID=159417 RepID=A0ABP0GJH8_CLALP